MTGFATWDYKAIGTLIKIHYAGSYSFQWTRTYTQICDDLDEVFLGTASETRTPIDAEGEPTDEDPCACSGSFTGAISGAGSMPYLNGWTTDLCGSSLSVPCSSGPLCSLGTGTIAAASIVKSCSNEQGSGDEDTELGDEYTTEQLVEVGTDRLADEEYDDDWNDTAGAFRDVSANELSLTLRKGKFRIQHAQPASGYLKIWFRKKTVLELHDETSYVDLPSYEWTSSTPGEGTITGPATEVQPPATDGTVTIEMKWSCDPDYEPAWGGQNGYAP